MYSILVVDDNKTNLQLLKQLLSDNYTVIPVLSGKMALHYVEKHRPDVILLDLLMPEMDGITAMHKIRELPNGEGVPVIFLTADKDQDTEHRCLKEGASDFISKPFVPEVMITRIEKVLEIERLRKRMYVRMEENIRQLEGAALQSFISIANTIDTRDVYRKKHLLRVACGVMELGKRMGMAKEELNDIQYCALSYDIGNIVIPDLLFMKQGKLTKKEQMLMVGHPTAGAKMLHEITCIPHIREAAYSHHERYDGTGYPRGIKGEEIPIEARMISIVDTFVAMTSDRAYRGRYTTKEACEEIKKGTGKQFDPSLVVLFLQMVEENDMEELLSQTLVPQSFSRDSGLLMHESNNLLKRVLKEQSFVINSMASLDPLTDLHNRKYLEMKVGAYLLEEQHEGCFCMIDVDNFKFINDTYGHQTGDLALQTLARILKRNARETDVVCRMGGDEFAIFFEGLTSTSVILKKTQRILEEYYMAASENKKMLHTTLSIGIAITTIDGRQYEELYRKADESLYYVKQNGKNNVYCPRSQENEDSTGNTAATRDMMDDTHKKCIK